MRKLLIVAVILLAGCTDAQQASISSMGRAHSVTCWNYSEIIYEGKTNGQVSDDGNKISFESQDGKYVEIYLGASSTCKAETL